MQSWPIIELIQVLLHRSISTGCTEIFSFVQFCKEREKKRNPWSLADARLHRQLDRHKHTLTYCYCLFCILGSFLMPPPLSLFLFCFALIFCPSLCCYLMELCRDVRFYVRWQQSRQVKATLSSLKTTCKLPTYSLAPFTFSPDHSPCCFAVANPPPPPRTGSELCSEMSNWHPVAEKHWRWLQSEGLDKQLRTGCSGR